MSQALRIGIPIIVVILALPFLTPKNRDFANPSDPPVRAPRAASHFPTTTALAPSSAAPPSSGVIEAAFQNGTSNLLVRESGIVHKVLSDDNDGSRHQRFIVQLSTGHTILIAHNIDLAPRVANINVGDVLTFQGEYEWKPEGGVVHWTHHNPRGTMPTGYIQHGGQLYQ